MITWQYAELALVYPYDDDVFSKPSITWSGPGGEENRPGNSDLMQLINQVGADGWELIGVLQEQDISTDFPFAGNGPGNTHSKPSARLFYFKRPIRSEYE
jgi:hypothetical protein